MDIRSRKINLTCGTQRVTVAVVIIIVGPVSFRRYKREEEEGNHINYRFVQIICN